MIRISVSDLESFRFWKADESSTMEELVSRLTHAEPPTRQMEAGRAFAKMMEELPVGAHLFHTNQDGYVFEFDDLEDAELALPDVRELKAEVVFDTPPGPVTLVGKCDGLDGIELHDQKLTEKWDPERYLDSLQWRAYLVMFKAKKFVYDVFLASYDRKDDHLVHVQEYHPFAVYAYPGIEQDVRRAVCELADVIHRYGIQNDLRSLVEEAAEKVAALGGKIPPAATP